MEVTEELSTVWLVLGEVDAALYFFEWHLLGVEVERRSHVDLQTVDKKCEVEVMAEFVYPVPATEVEILINWLQLVDPSLLRSVEGADVFGRKLRVHFAVVAHCTKQRLLLVELENLDA